MTGFRISNVDRVMLRLIAEAKSGRVLVAQITGWRALEHRGLIKIDFGPADTPDADRLCCYPTEKGRQAIG